MRQQHDNNWYGFHAIACLIAAGFFFGAGCREQRPPISFALEVKPILEAHCIRCHNDRSLFGNLNLQNSVTAARGSKSGPVIVPGKPQESKLYTVLLAPPGDEHGMPATGVKLSEPEKQVLYDWILQGGEWPEGAEGVIPVIDPDLPVKS